MSFNQARIPMNKAILLVDKQGFVGNDLAKLISSWGYYVDIASSAEEALQLLEIRPDKYSIITTGLMLHGMDGIKLCEQISLPCVIVSSETSSAYVVAAKAVGVSGYVAKNKASEDLEIVLKIVLAGGECYCVPVPKINKSGNKKPPNTIRLTKREKDVLTLIGQGKTTKEIAANLFIANTTVETHRRNLLDKLDVKNSKELIVYVGKHGIPS